MKKAIIILFVLTLTVDSLAQKWTQTFGIPNSEETSRGLIEYYDKGYLINGNYQDYQNWLIKTDINGNLLWDKVFTWEEGWLYWGRAVQDNDGNMIITFQTATSTLGTWPLVVKLDPCGEKLWCRVFADYDYMFGSPMDILISDDGDILVLTHFESQEQVDQIFLYCVDSEGSFKWKKSYASTSSHPLIGPKGSYRIFQINDFFLIAGYCYWPYPTNPDLKKLRPLFIKINDQFEEEWILPFGVSDSIVGEAFSLISLNDSTFMGVGKRRFTEGVEYLNNSLLMFFNINGVELGFNQIRNDSIGSNINQNLIFDIERIDDSLFLASSIFGEEYQGNSYGEFLIDTSGHIFISQSRPNTGGVSELIKTFDNKYIITTSLKEQKGDWDILMYKINNNLEQDSVYSSNFTYDSLCPYQIQSGIIDVTNCLVVTDVSELPSPEESSANLNIVLIEAFPNPVNGNEISFSYQNTKHFQNMELRCFNILGEMVHEEWVYPHQGESKVNITRWRPGIYLASVYSDGKVVGQKKFVVQ